MTKTFSTERICAFTDGVYAIVITLLVLELKAPEVPGLTNEPLFVDIMKQSRAFLAYFISFFVVGWLWFRHHGIFKALEKSNNVVIFINFIHLLFVSLIPYTASVAGRYARNSTTPGTAKPRRTADLAHWTYSSAFSGRISHFPTQRTIVTHLLFRQTS